LRILITGSRSWPEENVIRDAFKKVVAENPGEKITLVSGACPQGADRMGEDVARDLGWELELHPADWGALGKSAGFVRNSHMVKLGADRLLAFVHNNSKGGTMTVSLAKKADMRTVLHTINDEENDGALVITDSAAPIEVETIAPTPLW
jgi:hypothetical protein